MALFIFISAPVTFRTAATTISFIAIEVYGIAPFIGVENTTTLSANKSTSCYFRGSMLYDFFHNVSPLQNPVLNQFLDGLEICISATIEFTVNINGIVTTLLANIYIGHKLIPFLR